MTLTMDEAIDQICPKACTQCGEDLAAARARNAPPAGNCPACCATRPPSSWPGPGELARMQAEHHRQEAQRLLGEQVEQLLEADRVLHVDQLRQARSRAEDELTAGIARRDQAEAALKDPRREEERAAREQADAAAARRDFELELRKCERYRKGAKAVVHARQALALADEELAAKDAALASAQDRPRAGRGRVRRR